jgi:hypothetical protein
MVPAGAGEAPQLRLLTQPFAVAVFFEVEHPRCNHPIELVLTLETEDGHTVRLPGPGGGEQPVQIRQNVTVPSPAQAPIGSPGTGNALLEFFPGLPLGAGTYIWRVELDGENGADWHARFHVVAPPQQPFVTFGQPLAQG